jgi:uncharacterized protein YbdZ (MbtH family)
MITYAIKFHFGDRNPSVQLAHFLAAANYTEAQVVGLFVASLGAQPVIVSIEPIYNGPVPEVPRVATIQPNLVPITPIAREDDGSLWLQIDIPNGWDDVKKICKKVLSFEGHNYVFRSWNSITLKCHFKATEHVAAIVKRR